MTRLALLVLPSSNRVYADASGALVAAELEVFGRTVLSGRLGGIEQCRIGGVPYVTFECDAFTDRDAALLANVSALYALYALTGDLLRPVVLQRLDRFDSDLLTIQKYAGKTNELFTKLLLNVTLLSSAFAEQLLDRRFVVLDPLCGRGTTLNQALMYGFDAFGVDLDQQDVAAYAVFVQRWLKDKRLKHRAVFGPVRRNQKVVARRLEVSLAATKEDHRAGRIQRLDVVNAPTTRLLEFFRPESVDVVVADLPYGVQHASRSTGSAGSTGRSAGSTAGRSAGSTTGRSAGSTTGRSAGRAPARSPLELLTEGVPGWVRALRPGGALGMSWNTFVARRDDAAAILSEAGLAVLDDGPYRAFSHRVDQAIQRDVLVARKP